MKKRSMQNRLSFTLSTLLFILISSFSNINASTFTDGLGLGLSLLGLAQGNNLFPIFGDNGDETADRLNEIDAKLDAVINAQMNFTDSVKVAIKSAINLEIIGTVDGVTRYMQVNYKNAKINPANTTFDLDYMLNNRDIDLIKAIATFETINSGSYSREIKAATVSSYVLMTATHLALLEERVFIHLIDQFIEDSENLYDRANKVTEYINNLIDFCDIYTNGVNTAKSQLNDYIQWKKNQVRVETATRQVDIGDPHGVSEWVTEYQFRFIEPFTGDSWYSSWVRQSTSAYTSALNTANGKRNAARNIYQNEYNSFVATEVTPALEAYANLKVEFEALLYPTSSNCTIRVNDTIKKFSSLDFTFISEACSDTLVKIKITNISGGGLLFDNNPIVGELEIASEDLGKLTMDLNMFTKGVNTTFNFQVSNGIYYSNDSYTVTIQNPMILEYNTTLSEGTTVTLPLYGTVSVDVDWGDGSVERITTAGLHDHTYATEGTYNVLIYGSLHTFGSNSFYVSYSNIEKLTKAISFGDLSLRSLFGAFYGANNLESVPSLLPSTITNLTATFKSVKRDSISGLGEWDTKNVNTLERTFRFSTLNIDLSGWNVVNVTSFWRTFDSNPSFNSDLSSWDVSNATIFFHTFNGAASFNSDLSSWDVGKATRMENMFAGATSFNSDISNWNISNVTTMANMFSGVELPADIYSAILTKWSALTVKSNVIFDAGNSKYRLNTEVNRAILTDAPNSWTITDGGTFVDPMILEYNTNLSVGTDVTLPLYGTVYVDVNWGDGTIERITAAGLHNHTYATEGTYTVSINGSLSQFGTISSSYVNTEKLVQLESFGNIGLQSLQGAFQNAINLDSVPSVLPTIVTSLEHSFQGTQKSISGVDTWDVSRIVNMDSLFAGNTSSIGDLSGWNTGSVRTMQGMFSGATSFNGDISSWNVSNVTNMSDMFSGAVSFNTDLSTWDVGNCTNMSSMFAEATSFNCDLSSWNVTNVRNMSSMFFGATSFNCDLSKWDISRTDDLKNMFSGAISFNGDISSWRIRRRSELDGMFDGVTLSVENYDAILIAWNLLPGNVKDIVFSGGNSKYSPAAVSARDNLINNKRWVITDGGPADLIKISALDDITLGEDFAILELVDLKTVFKDYQEHAVTYTVTSLKNIVNPTIDTLSDLLKLESIENLTGVDTLVVTTTDGTESVSDTFTVTVTAVNDAPIIASSATTTATEDIVWSYTVATTDVDNADLTYAISGEPSGMTIADSVISWTPVNGQLTSGEVSVIVSDGLLTATEKFTITVTSVNDAPTLTIVEESEILSTDNLELTLDMTDASDIEGEKITLLLGAADNCTIEGLIVRPASDFMGTLEIPVSVTDGIDTSAVVVWQITVDLATAITSFDTISVINSSDFLFYPNPVLPGQDDIKLVIPSNVSGHVIVEIYDYLWASLDRAEFYTNGGETYHWDLKNKYGSSVASGVYIAVISWTTNNGVNQSIRRKIGIKR